MQIVTIESDKLCRMLNKNRIFFQIEIHESTKQLQFEDSLFIFACLFPFNQVWFQNARAKWRRMMMKQEGKSGGPESEKGDMSLDLDSYSDHSPSFMMSGPHSPHSMD